MNKLSINPPSSTVHLELCSFLAGMAFMAPKKVAYTIEANGHVTVITTSKNVLIEVKNRFGRFVVA